MPTAHIELPVQIAAPRQTVWSVLTDWNQQGRWMLGTDVWITDGDGALGSRLAAFTGFGGVGVLDTMRITEFEAPQHCKVSHDGAILRGEGGFDLSAGGPRTTTVVWWETLYLPVVIGWGWPLVKPAFAHGVRTSLDRLAKLCEKVETGRKGST